MMQETKLNRRLSDGVPARIKQVSHPEISLSSSLTKYFRIVGGVLLAATLLVPVIWIPGLVVLVLPSEVYLLEWVHSQYTKSHVKTSRFDRSNKSDFNFKEAERKRSATLRYRQSAFVR